MRFTDAVLRDAGGVVVAEGLSGFLNAVEPSGPRLASWSGSLDFPPMPEGLRIFQKLAVKPGNAELEIPGVLKGSVIVTRPDGSFQGSGVPELLRKDT